MWFSRNRYGPQWPSRFQVRTSGKCQTAPPASARWFDKSWRPGATPGGASSLRNSDSAHQIAKSRLVVESLEGGVTLQERHHHVAVIISALERVERLAAF